MQLAQINSTQDLLYDLGQFSLSEMYHIVVNPYGDTASKNTLTHHFSHNLRTPTINKTVAPRQHAGSEKKTYYTPQHTAPHLEEIMGCQQSLLNHSNQEFEFSSFQVCWVVVMHVTTTV